MIYLLTAVSLLSCTRCCR